MSGGIFISYRRGDSAGFAGRIYDRVASRLNRELVFFDVDNIELGADFVRVLSERVAECDALVAVIGRDWLSATDEEGRRRLDDPDDFVRIEIETALQRDIPVIPVLVDDAAMPRKENLPDALKPLARRQGLEIAHARFDSDSERLTKALAFVEEARRKREQAAAELEERQRRELEAARLAEDERRKAEAEATQRVEDERRRREEAQAAKQIEEERRKAEAEAAQRAEDERRRSEEAQAAKGIEEERQRGAAPAALHAEEEKRPPAEAEPARFTDLPKPADLPKTTGRSASWRLIAAVAGVAILAAAAFFIAGHGVPQNPTPAAGPTTAASPAVPPPQPESAASTLPPPQPEPTASPTVPPPQPEPAVTPASAPVMVIAAPPPDYFVQASISRTPDTKLSLVQQSAKRNQITDDEEWWTSNRLERPFLDPAPSTIPATFQGQSIRRAIRGDPILAIYGQDGQYLLAIDPATGAIRFAMDFAAFQMPHDYVPEDRAFITMETEWAALEGNILFVSHSHRTYAASSKGYNAYISAVDINTGQLLWHSKPLVSNSSNFLVKDDAIMTGYGFTAEDHYLYILNKADGRVARQMPIRKSIDWLIEHDGKLFVRTYDTDFIFTYAVK